MAIVTSSAEWPRAKAGGDVVRVPVPGKPGVFIKMHRADAIAQGLLKEQEPVKNKKRSPAKNKGRSGNKAVEVNDG